MAIRIWQPKWYKFWCDGVKWNYSPQYIYEDERNNSIKRTHRGYIIPEDANLEVEPSTAWYIYLGIVEIIVCFLMIITGYYIYAVWGIIGLLLAIGIIPVIIWMLFSIYRLILLIIYGGFMPRDRLLTKIKSFLLL